MVDMTQWKGMPVPLGDSLASAGCQAQTQLAVGGLTQALTV